jgi:hypothetical protein
VGGSWDDVRILHRHEVLFDDDAVADGGDRMCAQDRSRASLAGAVRTACGLLAYVAVTVAACASTVLIVGVMLEAQCTREGGHGALSS